jgi:hypothetical protein
MVDGEYRRVIDECELDAFFQESTLHLANAWEEIGGRSLTLEEMQGLNDVLTAYFNGKR